MAAPNTRRGRRLVATAIAPACAFAAFVVLVQSATGFSVSHERRSTPTNGKIVFGSDRGGGNGELFTMDPDGSHVTRLTNNNDVDAHASWSPDGRRIVFIRQPKGGTADIYVMDADGRRVTRLTNNDDVDILPAWSPDGTKIAFARGEGRDSEIYVMSSVDGSSPRALTRNGTEDVMPAWSPDGKKIAFVSDRSGNTEIHVMSVDGGGQTQLTRRRTTTLGPAWSPDGQMIAFASLASDDLAHVFVMNAGGGGLRSVGRSAGNDAFPRWSPDGKKLVFFSTRDGNGEIYVMNADGSGQVNLTKNPARDQEPHWGTSAAGSTRKPPVGAGATREPPLSSFALRAGDIPGGYHSTGGSPYAPGGNLEGYEELFTPKSRASTAPTFVYEQVLRDRKAGSSPFRGLGAIARDRDIQTDRAELIHDLFVATVLLPPHPRATGVRKLAVKDEAYVVRYRARSACCAYQAAVVFLRVDRYAAVLTIGTIGDLKDAFVLDVTRAAAKRLAQTAKLAPKSTALPTISGTPVGGETVTATSGTWSGKPASFAYQWQRCDASGGACAAIAGATGQTYVVAVADLGSALRVTVTARNTAGSAAATSAVTSVVSGYVDTFTGDRVSPFWSLGTTGNGPTIAQANGQLEVTFPAGTSPGSGGYANAFAAMTCRFPGDFDMQVDYRLLSGLLPAAGVHVGFDAAEFTGQSRSGTHGMFVSTDRGAHGISTHFGSVNDFVQDSSLSGTLRLVRTTTAGVTTVTASRLNGPSWSFASPPYTAPTSQAANLNAFTNLTPFPTEIRIAYDNFRINSGTITCP